MKRRDENDRPPMAVAMMWVSRITTISLEMVVPGLVGLWIDRQLGTEVLATMLGFGLGLAVAILHLVRLVPRDSGDSSGGRGES